MEKLKECENMNTDTSGLDAGSTPDLFLNIKEAALRYNQGKPRMSLIDLNALEDCARVLEFGANKYDINNWKKGFDVNTILDSMMRHIAALQRGEMNDPETGISHIGHIQANAMFLGCKNNWFNN